MLGGSCCCQAQTILIHVKPPILRQTRKPKPTEMMTHVWFLVLFPEFLNSWHRRQQQCHQPGKKEKNRRMKIDIFFVVVASFVGAIAIAIPLFGTCIFSICILFANTIVNSCFDCCGTDAAGVGKSCLLLRYSDDQFSGSYISTIGYVRTYGMDLFDLNQLIAVETQDTRRKVRTMYSSNFFWQSMLSVFG